MSLAPRSIEPILKRRMAQYPVVSITGPRQSGKSTLAQIALPDYQVLNLENPELRSRAVNDPVGFIADRPDKLIIDEAQYAPELFSMIQVKADERNTCGQYVLTGSQNFQMMKHVSQSLAGRVGILRLLPFSYHEALELLPGLGIEQFAYIGGYPRLYQVEITPQEYYNDYIQTYLNRDVSNLQGVRNLSSFNRFLQCCALNAGSLLNISALANEVDVAVNTVKSWLSVLEASYIIMLLPPYSKNARRRLTKTPKLYFCDTGLLCHLLHLSSTQKMMESDKFGSIFENLIISETLKAHLNRGSRPEMYFYRDDEKREIDLVDETNPDHPKLIEIKSARMYREKYAGVLRKIGNEVGIPEEDQMVLLRTDETYKAHGMKVVSARDYLISQGEVRRTA